MDPVTLIILTVVGIIGLLALGFAAYYFRYEVSLKADKSPVETDSDKDEEIPLIIENPKAGFFKRIVHYVAQQLVLNGVTSKIDENDLKNQMFGEHPEDKIDEMGVLLSNINIEPKKPSDFVWVKKKIGTEEPVLIKVSTIFKPNDFLPIKDDPETLKGYVDIQKYTYATIGHEESTIKVNVHMPTSPGGHST